MLLFGRPGIDMSSVEIRHCRGDSRAAVLAEGFKVVYRPESSPEATHATARVVLEIGSPASSRRGAECPEWAV
jgi:hypothetical protein